MRPITATSQVLSPIFPIVYARRISARCSCRDEHGPDDESFSLLALEGLPLKITKRTQGFASRSARGGRMTNRFLASHGLPPNLYPKLRNEPKAAHPGVSKAAG
jgi:hypothetical protein